MHWQPFRALVVDDDVRYARFVEELLRQETVGAATVQLATTYSRAQNIVSSDTFDVGLIDYLMDEGSGLELVSRGLAHDAARPFILITGHPDPELSSVALRAGATDYLSKAELNPDTLLRSVRYALDRAEARRALQASEERFRRYFLRSVAGAWQNTLDGQIVDVNQSFAAILGYAERHELMQTLIDHLFADASEMEAVRAKLLEEGRITNQELRLRRRDGTIVWCLVNASIGYDAYGKPGTIEGTLIDLSERRVLEEQLRQAQKMEAIGQLAGGLAHDFNNLLTAILGYAEIVGADVPPDSATAQDLRQITAAGERARDLTRQLLAFSRKQVLAPHVLDLRAPIERFLRMAPRLIGEHIQVTSSLAEELWRVLVDPAQLEQVLLNLFVNARDAMPEGGRITVEASNVVLDAQYARLHPTAQPGEYVALAVSDTGIGMSPEVQARAFEPFFTTKPTGQGTGLGLSTAYGIVKQSGGHIWVYSEQGRGTTFKIYLPRIVDDAADATEPGASAFGDRGRETILLVEDEPLVRGLAESVLRRRGYSVLSAATPAEALALCAEHDGTIHLLLTDIVMPGMNGRDLAAHIRRARPDIRVLFASGYTDGAIADQGFLQTDNELLQKPFTAAGLARAVRAALDRP